MSDELDDNTVLSFKADEAQKISEFGFAVRCVFDPDGKDPMFAYTIGRALDGKPDVIVVGNYDPGVLHWIVTESTKQELSHGARSEWPSQLECVFIRVTDLEAAGMTGALSYDQTEAYQCVWPAPNGAFPWDDAYPIDDPQSAQPLYGERP